MSQSNKYIQSLETIFSQATTEADGFTPRQLQKKPRVSKRELEIALAVLLVELASSDQSFEPTEYEAIVQGLHTVFGTPRSEITGLVNQATTMLTNLRGTSKFAELLRDNLDAEQQAAVLQAIEGVIGADGVEEGFEIYLRERFKKQLEAPTPEQPAKQKASFCPPPQEKQSRGSFPSAAQRKRW